MQLYPSQDYITTGEWSPIQSVADAQKCKIIQTNTNSMKISNRWNISCACFSSTTQWLVFCNNIIQCFTRSQINPTSSFVLKHNQPTSPDFDWSFQFSCRIWAFEREKNFPDILLRQSFKSRPILVHQWFAWLSQICS